MRGQSVVLSVKNLEIEFKVRQRQLKAIRRVSMDLYEGETLAIVGESGSGKSVLIKSFTGMLESNGEITRGEILFEGKDISQFKNNRDW